MIRHNSTPNNPTRSRTTRRNPSSLMEHLESRILFSGYTFKTIASFNGTNGAVPFFNTPIIDKNGNLFGTTTSGGVYSNGDIYELAKGSTTITKLSSFSLTDGSQPQGLVFDSSGNLWITCATGGANNDGTICELPKGSGTVKLVASFNGTTGATPNGPLAVDKNNNLFGTCFAGGLNNVGDIFELAKGSTSITKLVSFNTTNGANPQGGVILDSSGNLYGTASQGGAEGLGTIFELPSGSHTIKVLATFDGSLAFGDQMESPIGSLAFDSSGNLFGSTLGSTPRDGLTFELKKGASTITPIALLHVDGQSSQVLFGPVLDSKGNVFVGSDASVFEIPHGTNTATPLVTLPDNNLDSGVVLDASGNLFGTYDAGTSNLGAIFELSPS